MVEKIIKVISNLKVLSKMNEIIDGLNTHTTNTNNPHNVTAEQLGLATAYVYKGSVTNFSDLPTNAQNGWVYSVENEYIDSSGNVYPAGSNFAWNGSKWDDLGGSLSGYAKSVNSQTPDSKGNVFLNLVESLEKNTEDKLIVHNADGTTQEIELGKNNDNDLNNILDSITELENRVIPIEKGGTGATTASEACANIGALPLSGGTMTGPILFTHSVVIKKDTNDGYIQVNATTDYTKGAYLYLTGQDSNDAGGFTLGASSNGNIYKLKGSTDGTLTWNGKSIVGKTWVRAEKSTSFTASYDCIAFFQHNDRENYQTVTVNGTAYYHKSHHTSASSMTIPLKAGDVVTTTNIQSVWVMEMH